MKVTTTLVILWFINHSITAQYTEVFVIFHDLLEKRKVFYTDNESQTLKLRESINASTDRFLDSFIIKPVSAQKSTSYIVAAKESSLFLKRKGNQLVFEEIENEDTASELKHYEWEIQYFGVPYIAISDPFSTRRVIYIDNNTLLIKEIPENEWNLTDNNDPKGNSYRFKIKKIANSF